MIGWLIAAGLALTLLGALILARLPRVAWEVTAAALLLGLAGYAWQGNPGLPGTPRAARHEAAGKFDEKLAEQRRSMAERYGPAGQWLTLSDGYARRGQTKEAANVLRAGLRDSPDDANLWLGLGNALVNHGGMVTPGAEFAYRRALTVARGEPAAAFFYGLALARDNRLAEARVQWAPLVTMLPRGAPLRTELEQKLALIDSILRNDPAPRPR